MRAFAAILAALIATSVHAQTAPQSQWSDAVEVVITAPKTVTIRARCPAMWKLSKGNATVWVLPTLDAARADMWWDTSCVTRVVKGANSLILQRNSRMFPVHFDHLPKGTRLKDVVSATTYAHFLAVTKRLNVLAESYDTYQGRWAGGLLLGRAFTLRNLVSQSYPDALPDVARHAKTPVETIEYYQGDIDPGTGAQKSAYDQDPAYNEACLNGKLDYADYALDTLPLIVTAWEKSDIPTVIAKIRPEDDRCYPPDFDAGYVERENIDRWTKALGAALDRPGKTVAAVSLPWLLHRDGVLDRLAAQGVTINPPKGVDEREQ